ncbi:MAG TPA: primosomal protein N', partial [Thioalkalivibrio sp.]|nr:primosomal protein N' [Thioalkalivibrio sp.]
MSQQHSLPICQVGVPGPFGEPLDYLVPAGPPGPVPGARVRVDLGRRQVVGVVTGLAASSPIPRNRLRPVRQVLDPESVLDEPLLRLLLWAAEYYQHPVGEVLTQALPVLVRQGRPAEAATRTQYSLTPEGIAQDPGGLSRAPRQAALLDMLREAPGGLSGQDLEAMPPGRWQAVVRALMDKGWVVSREVARGAAPPPPPRSGPALNEAQAAAVAAVQAG